MGCGISADSQRIERQEQYVRERLQKVKSALNEGRNYKIDYLQPYTDEQVAGKLRQAYHNSDLCRENYRSYINPEEWIKVKSRNLF